MLKWESLRVLVLGGAGQCGIEICRQLCARGVEAIMVHDLELGRSEAAIEAIRAGIDTRAPSSSPAPAMSSTRRA